jgi:hypothetical protein
VYELTFGLSIPGDGPGHCGRGHGQVEFHRWQRDIADSGGSSAARCRAATGCPQLARLGGRQPAVVLKIETQRGFENLPDMLLAAMQWDCLRVFPQVEELRSKIEEFHLAAAEPDTAQQRRRRHQLT